MVEVTMWWRCGGGDSVVEVTLCGGGDSVVEVT